MLIEPRVLSTTGPVSGVGHHGDFHGSSSDDADDPSSRGSSRPNSAHDEEQVISYGLYAEHNPLLLCLLTTNHWWCAVCCFFSPATGSLTDLLLPSG